MATLLTKIINTHDTEENWNRCKSFIPEKGEIIVYDKDSTHNYQRFKIGDGTTTIVNLPFAINETIEDFLNEKDDVCYIDAGKIIDY